MMSLTLAELYEEPESRLRQRRVNPANELLRHQCLEDCLSRVSLYKCLIDHPPSFTEI